MGWKDWTKQDRGRLTQPLLGSCVFVYNMMLCSVENPENSLFWLFPDMCDAMIEAEGFSISFHNCMYGGKRKKLTKWWSTKDVFAELQSLCDGKACKMEPCAAGISPVPDSGRGSVSAFTLQKNSSHTAEPCHFERCSAGLTHWKSKLRRRCLSLTGGFWTCSERARH